jgi:acyl dehydratase
MREIPISEIQTLVGQEIGVSDWLEITQDRVNRFADATGDHQWIHVDVERATKELGAPIAHGYLVLSLIPFLAKNIVSYTGVSRGINYGSNKSGSPTWCRSAHAYGCAPRCCRASRAAAASR